MKTRSAKTKKTVQNDCGDSSTSTGLDENLWGILQYHIDLAEDVYSKLPFEDFFHLRTVCKDWYVIACKRLDLKEPIHTPIFKLMEDGPSDGILDGILIYNPLSRSWNWRSGWSYVHTSSSYEEVIMSKELIMSKGVMFCHGWGIFSEYATLYHCQSKSYLNLELPLNPPRASSCRFFGIVVPEKQGPLSSFKVVLGSPDFDTQVYESGVWQTKPCRVPKHETEKLMREKLMTWKCTPTACVDYNGRVYICSMNTTVICVYDFENAKWSLLLRPGEQQYRLHTLGLWNGRIFDVTFQCEPNKKVARSIQVWELVDETLHKWKVYDCMPKGLLLWLQSTKGFPSVHLTKDEYIRIHLSFCRGFMLVYSWNDRVGLVGRFCLFNIATKNWQKLNVAA